ncbi:MAG: PhzF family phenazine biosynthesis protein [Lewinella sp.]|nr:PhzF family phenazine biosynthesis protein [Lewinella sp.]
METLRLYQVDAFTHHVFGGNPAAVVPLTHWLPDEQLQAIATENNLSETAFFLPETEEGWPLRWFTPAAEVRLCGHATLATAHVLFQEIGYTKPRITFTTLSGPLYVERLEEGYRMDFPADPPELLEASGALTQQALGQAVVELYSGKDDLLVILDGETAVRNCSPDFGLLSRIEKRGVIVTARGKEVDFVSRCFYPRFGINEDPVTGSAHTLMTPYWAEKLGQDTLVARQLSARQGDLVCHQQGERVWLDGQAVTFLRGQIVVPG